jgi:hypothetical protein
VRYDAFTAILIPGMLGAPSSDVKHIFASATEARGAVSGRAVASTRIGKGEAEK